MELSTLLQVAQLAALIGGFAATIAVNRNDSKWIVKSLEAHQDEDNRRFDELRDYIRDRD